jgi:lipid-A-disaccharide synthase
MRIFISAGEASGDALGAALLAALKDRVPELTAFGMGGPRMKALGFEAHHDAREVGVVGLVEVLRHLPRLFRLKDELADLAIVQKPDVAVLIDVPDFNIRVAKRLKKAGIPVVFYVAPSAWAWRSSRVHSYKKHIDRLLVLFPFELPVWERAGVDVLCVGHPLIDEIPMATVEPDLSIRTIALLPGSRRGEVHRHLGTMLAAAKILLSRGLVERFVLPVAPTLDRTELSSQIDAAELTGKVDLVEGTAGDPEPRRKAVAGSSVALVASGTATLETALIGVPQVIFYRVSALSWFIMRKLTKITHLGLPNIIAGREIAPELLQKDFTVAALVETATKVLSSRPVAQASRLAYAEVRAKLGDTGAAKRAADAVLEIVKKR